MMPTPTPTFTPTPTLTPARRKVRVARLEVGRSQNGVQGFTARNTFKRGERVTVLAYVVQDGQPIQGILVTIQVREPNGGVVPLQMTTDTQGFALTRYQLSRRAQSGKYELQLVSVTGGDVELDFPSSITRTAFTVY